MIQKFSQKAFTLIELMIVAAIIGIAIALIIPTISNIKSKQMNIEESIDLNKDRDSGSTL